MESRGGVGERSSTWSWGLEEEEGPMGKHEGEEKKPEGEELTEEPAGEMR